MFKDKFYLDLELREMAKYMRETELRERTCEKVQTLNKQLMNTLPCKICRAIFSINLSILLVTTACEVACAPFKTSELSKNNKLKKNMVRLQAAS